jgi:hypothetical protein
MDCWISSKTIDPDRLYSGERYSPSVVINTHIGNAPTA